MFLLTLFSRFKVFLSPYRDLERPVFSKRGKVWPYFMELLGERERESQKEIFQVAVQMSIVVWCTCLQLVVITPQLNTVISQYRMWTYVSLFLQGHFLFMFLNIGYHCDPNSLLLESVFNKMKGLYWRIFLLGKKNEPIEKLITEISLIICFWKHGFRNVYI